MQKLFCLILFISVVISPLAENCLAQLTAAEHPSAKNHSTPAAGPADAHASRAFEFRYGATIAELPAGAEVKVWIPIAETNPQQTVALKNSATPGLLNFGRDVEHQNKIGSFKFTVDELTNPKFELVYDVQRSPAVPYQSKVPRNLQLQTYSRYLKANRTVPISGKPIELIQDMALPENSPQTARKLYDLVFEHMDYDKSKPGYGNGDSVWACDSRTGNCTDFHSLFISLARNRSLAARFEIGFPLPRDQTSGKIGGYHCWAWFLSPESGWVPVDISEADKHPEMKDKLFGYLPPDRVAFSTGRDIVLVPASQSSPQNFFVYPHVEVDGEAWPKEKIKLDFSFEDKQLP